MTRKAEDEDEFLRAVSEILARRAAPTARADAEEAARGWAEQGFDDAEEVAAWLDAGCAEAAHARRLDDAGITPEQAALRTSAGASDAEDTLGRKLARGELSLEEARRIITREFWHD
jgi:hypothetical protein